MNETDTFISIMFLANSKCLNGNWFKKFQELTTLRKALPIQKNSLFKIHTNLKELEMRVRR